MPSTTVTRSISFAPDILAELDKRAKLLRMRRSEYVNRILEQEFGLAVKLEPVRALEKLPLPAARPPGQPTVVQALPRIPKMDGMARQATGESKKVFRRE